MKFSGTIISNFFRGASLDAMEISSVEGKKYVLWILSKPSNNWAPPKGLYLIYLVDPKLGIIDWKSYWGYDLPEEHISIKKIDMNGDGYKDISFVWNGGILPEQILAGYTIAKGCLWPVMVKPSTVASVRFEETRTEDGMIVRPCIAGRTNLYNDILYEIPVKVINGGSAKIDMEYYYLTIEDWECVAYFSYDNSRDVRLGPGDSDVIKCVIMFRPYAVDRNIKIIIKKAV